jgi:hypothetical protein
LAGAGPSTGCQRLTPPRQCCQIGSERGANRADELDDDLRRGWRGGNRQVALLTEQDTAGVKPLEALLIKRWERDPTRCGMEFDQALCLTHLVSNQRQLNRCTGCQLPQLRALILSPPNSDIPVEGARKGSQQDDGKASALQGQPPPQLQRIRRKRRD